MEEITSFQSSTSFLTEPTPTLLQQRLQYIVESCQEWWVYAIFWQASKDDHHHLLLSFADSFVNRSHHQSLDQGINTNHGIFRGSELIMSSFLRSFVPGDDLIGRTFGSGSYLWLAGDHAFQLESSRRAKEAHLHGIKTLVCIATSWGVAEFGSSHVLKEDWDLVQLAKSLFTSETNQVQQFAQLCIGAQNGISVETKEEGRMEMNISPTRADILKKRGRKAKNTTTDDQVNPKYIDMERQRREKLNQRFYALRSVVPYVSKMDKASLLADAVTYISELNSKIETLTQKAESLQKNMEDVSPLSTKYMIHESEVEVRILGSKAMIRVQSPDVNHPAARLMDAMRKLEIRVHHASVSNISDLVIQDVIAHIPKGYTMNDEEALRASIQNYL